MYKVISKIIANYLKPLLPQSISTEQLGYVKERQILHDIMVSHETIHSLKLYKKLGMLLKVDLSKALTNSNRPIFF